MKTNKNCFLEIDENSALPDYILTPYYKGDMPCNLSMDYDSLNYSEEAVNNNLLIIPPSFNKEVVFDFQVETVEFAIRSSRYYSKICSKMGGDGYRFTPKETTRLIFDLNEITYFHIRNIIVSDLKKFHAEQPERKVEQHSKWNGIVDIFENLDTVAIEYLERNMYEDDWYLRGVADISYQIRIQNGMPIPKKFMPLFKAFDMELAEVTK